LSVSQSGPCFAPDIDVVLEARRGEVLEYGSPKIRRASRAQIITSGKLKRRAWCAMSRVMDFLCGGGPDRADDPNELNITLDSPRKKIRN